jgi:lysophospholipase L1-like esterase
VAEVRGRFLHGLWVAVRITALCLVAAELFLRFVRPVEFRAPLAQSDLDGNDDLLYRRSSVPGLIYDLTPNMKKSIIAATWVETNGEGMRDREPLPADTPGLVRIAVVGDSFSFGLGVSGDDVYAEVLEKLLQAGAADGRRYDVLNFSVPGYTSQQEAVALETKVLPWKPQVIVLGYCLNDPETLPLHPVHTYFTPVEWWQHFHLARLAALFALTMETNRYGGGDYYRFLHVPGRDRWQSTTKAFARIAELTRPLGIPVIVVLFPIVEITAWDAYPYREVHHQVAAAARDAGFDVVDLLPAWEKYPPTELRLAEFDNHPTPLGHRLAAEAIESRILNVEF